MATYKQNLKEGLEIESQNSQEAVKIFFDREKSKNDRINAFKKFGTFISESDLSNALDVFRDEKEPSEIRANAVLGLTNYASVNEHFIDELIDVLNRKIVAPEIKEAALSVLQANTFSSSLLSDKRPQYNNALKSLIETDTTYEIKERAIEYLALEKDEYIQDKLLKGLKNPNEELVKPEIAIQLLSYDLHSDAFPVLREIAQNSPNLRAKKEALRNLSTDPEAANLLLNTLNDKNEDEEIRHVCAVGLQSLQPDLLLDSLKNILVDSTENTELQVALLNTLNYIPKTDKVDSDDSFQIRLEKLTSGNFSKKLRKTFQNYLNNKMK